MPYNKLLKRIVAESGYNSKEIIELCNEKGQKMDKSYFSKLLNNKIPPPSENISRVLAEICNVDERKLVLEGYIDKAPNEIKEAFLTIKSMSMLYTLNMFRNRLDTEQFKYLENELKKEPLSDFIIDIIDNKIDTANFNCNEVEFSKENDNSLKLSFKEPVTLSIYDNAMFPLIPQNSKVSFKIPEKYCNGDIIVAKIKDKEDFIFRYVLFDGDNVILTPLNTKEYKTITMDKKDVDIIGKVDKVITEI